MLRNFTRPT